VEENCPVLLLGVPFDFKGKSWLIFWRLYTRAFFDCNFFHPIKTSVCPSLKKVLTITLTLVKHVTECIMAKKIFVTQVSG